MANLSRYVNAKMYLDRNVGSGEFQTLDAIAEAYNDGYAAGKMDLSERSTDLLLKELYKRI